MWFCRWARQPAGPARQAGNFHLLAQMKVTKAKGLNASDPSPTLRQEDSVDDVPLSSTSGSAIPEDLCETRALRRDGSAPRRNSHTLWP